MQLTQVMVLCFFVLLTGCVTEKPQFSGPHPVSYQEVLHETLLDAVVSKKRQVAMFGEYSISARPVTQISSDCWTVHQVIRKYDLLDSEKYVRVCNKDGKFYTTTSNE